MRPTLPAVSLIALILAAGPALAQDDGRSAIDADRMNQAVRVLASDAFEGRGPVSAGEEKTVEWLAEQFRAAGA